MITLAFTALVVLTKAHEDEHALFSILLPFCFAADVYLMAHWS